MGSTEVLTPNVGSLQDELERAKTNLKGLNENIRRIIGREPNDAQLRGDRKRTFGAGGNAAPQSYYVPPALADDRKRSGTGAGGSGDFSAPDRNQHRRRHLDASPPPFAFKRSNNNKNRHNDSSTTANVDASSSAPTKSVFSRLSGPPATGRNNHSRDHYHNFNQHHQQHHQPHHHHHHHHHRQYTVHNDLAVAADAAAAADADNDVDAAGQEVAVASVASAAAAVDAINDDDIFDVASPDESVQVAATAAPRPRLHSRVIRELPTRQEIVAAQGTDAAARARNRRMFGSLLGTLQKFCQEESRLKPKEDRKAQIEQKLEAAQLQERETMRRERQDLFATRKRQQLEIKQLETKMARMRELAAWEAAVQPLGNFVRTRAKPYVYYLPRVLDERTAERLAESRLELEKTIAKKRADVNEELAGIEARFKTTADGALKPEDGGKAKNGSTADGKHNRRSSNDDDDDDDEEDVADDDEDDDGMDTQRSANDVDNDNNGHGDATMDADVVVTTAANASLLVASVKRERADDEFVVTVKREKADEVSRQVFAAAAYTSDKSDAEANR